MILCIYRMYTMIQKFSLLVAISILTTLFITGCRRKNTITPEQNTGDINIITGNTIITPTVTIWSNVRIHYSITTADGAIRKQEDNISLAVWSNTLNTYVESQLIDMQKNEEKKILVEPTNGFGTMYDFEKEEKLPVSVFTSANIIPESGQRYDLGWIKWYVIGFSGQNNETVIFNTNPIYTWKDITYTVKILDIQ